MAQSIPALVEPSVLRWARLSIGLTPTAAARRIAVPDGRVDEWEAGTAQPTIAQLRAAAVAYKRPLGVFFLPEPPRSFDAMRDFRRLDAGADREWSPELHAEYRRALAQREHALELAELDERPPPTVWSTTVVTEDDDEERVGAFARHVLTTTQPAPPPVTGTEYDALNYWTAAAEDAGILVMSTSQGRVLTQEMRAFSLYFDQYPVIMVNGSDAPRGRLFSLLHEYAHLLLHTGGLCDTVTSQRETTADRRLEARCNAVAAAALMPAEAVIAWLESTGHGEVDERWSYAALRGAAAPFGVSAEAFLRRLVTLGRASRELYDARRPQFVAAYEADSDRSRGGGNWYRNTARDLGKGYVRRVADAHRRRVIDSYTAATYLNAKVGQISKLAEEAAVRLPA
ncbi:XRE family transcriptional regulator [Parafrankia elaeagni]|uniref:XRE family transcriptional regulator n=1 Tax=Parafrankia elaeagni TaxID=222534 RepID=UPI00037E05BC|nr:XRE family transcriptional regulator [Parafrankia elaeagni]